MKTESFKVMLYFDGVICIVKYNNVMIQHKYYYWMISRLKKVFDWGFLFTCTCLSWGIFIIGHLLHDVRAMSHLVQNTMTHINLLLKHWPCMSSSTMVMMVHVVNLEGLIKFVVSWFSSILFLSFLLWFCCFLFSCPDF